ncbi:MAG: hypothetical protein JNL60_09335, partial [Bacteroidia bacterium]|nr:hypothetical protein [Bacteroidia bacterium]
YINGEKVPYHVSGIRIEKDPVYYNYAGHRIYLNLPKIYSYDVISILVDAFNDNLEEFYRQGRAPNTEKYPDIKPFLY